MTQRAETVISQLRKELRQHTESQDCITVSPYSKKEVTFTQTPTNCKSLTMRKSKSQQMRITTNECEDSTPVKTPIKTPTKTPIKSALKSTTAKMEPVSLLKIAMGAFEDTL